LRTTTLALVVALLLPGCVTAHNYLDQDGPFLAGSLGVAPAADRELRIVTYNVKNGRKLKEAIAALSGNPALRQADVLVMQEMDGPGVEEVASALALNYVYFPASCDPRDGREFGNAVLSPWPILEAWKVLLPGRARVNQRARAATAARVAIGGRVFRVYSVHLGSPLGMSGAARRAQAETLVRDAASSTEPLLMAGDFNSKGVGQVFVKAGFAWPTENVGRSIGPFSYDHVFVGGLADGDRLEAAGVAREAKQASDHRPVWATLLLEPFGLGSH
jgi:endonuclease/exonuclease/phosphatase family metal-dependent hydrolase